MTPAEKSEILTARISNDTGFTMRDIDDRADQLGLSRTQFVLNAVKMLLKMDKATLELIKKESDDLSLPEYIVLQNSYIGHLAMQDAYKKVWGKNQVRTIEGLKYCGDDRRFAFVNQLDGSTKLLTGYQLYKFIEPRYTEEFQKLNTLLELALRNEEK